MALPPVARPSRLLAALNTTFCLAEEARKPRDNPRCRRSRRVPARSAAESGFGSRRAGARIFVQAIEPRVRRRRSGAPPPTPLRSPPRRARTRVTRPISLASAAPNTRSFEQDRQRGRAADQVDEPADLGIGHGHADAVDRHADRLDSPQIRRSHMIGSSSPPPTQAQDHRHGGMQAVADPAMVSCIRWPYARPARRSPPPRREFGDVGAGALTPFSPAPRSTTQRRSGSAPQARIRSRTARPHRPLFSAFSLSGTVEHDHGDNHRGARSKTGSDMRHAPCDCSIVRPCRQGAGLQSLESTGRRMLAALPASVTHHVRRRARSRPARNGAMTVRLSGVLVAHDEAAARSPIVSRPCASPTRCRRARSLHR